MHGRCTTTAPRPFLKAPIVYQVYASLPHQPRAKEPGGAYQKLAEDQMEPGGAAA